MSRGLYLVGHPGKTSMSGWTCCSSGLSIHLVYIMYWQYKQILLKQPPMTAEFWSHPVAGRSLHHPWIQAWRCGTMACSWSTGPMRVWLVTTQRRNMPPRPFKLAHCPWQRPRGAWTLWAGLLLKAETLMVWSSATKACLRDTEWHFW